MNTVCRLGLLVAIAIGAVSCQKPEVAKKDHIRRGDSYANQQNYSEAIIEYRNAVQIDPVSGEARKKLGQAYLPRA